MYKNEDYLKKEIMNQSRHLFMFGYNSQDRSKFLKSLETDYPYTADFSKPIALYFDSFGLPKAELDIRSMDIYMLQSMCREYLAFLVASKILSKTIRFNDTNLDDKLSWLISLTNINRNPNYAEIVSPLDLLREFNVTRDFYYENYIKYVNGLIESIPIADVSIPFLDLEMFVNQYKRCMNMQTYFGVLFDKKSELSVFSIQAINNLIGARINSDISVKVAVEPDNWETYCGVNGQHIEPTHDYGIVELDDSYGTYTRKLMKTNK